MKLSLVYDLSFSELPLSIVFFSVVETIKHPAVDRQSPVVAAASCVTVL